MTTLAMLFWAGEIDEVAAPVTAPRMLAHVGRSSLFVYWIHVELVYGYATWAIHRRLPLWGTAIAYVLFTALMYGAVVLRDHLAVRWRRRKQQMTLHYEGQAV
jgi:hypothetical protein